MFRNESKLNYFINYFGLLLLILTFFSLIAFSHTAALVSMLVVILFVVVIGFGGDKGKDERVDYFFVSYGTFLLTFFFLESLFIYSEYAVYHKMVILLKLSIFYILLFGLFFKNSGCVQQSRALLAFGVYLFVLLSVNQNSLAVKMYYFLNSFLPLLMILIILSMKYKYVFVAPKVYFIVYLICLFIGLGFFMGVYSWPSSFFEITHEDSQYELVNQLPRTWFTSFFGIEYFQRLNGLSADPIMFGYITSILAIISFYYFKNSIVKIFVISLMFLFIVLSFSKGALYLFLLFTLFLVISPTFIYKNIWIWVCVVLLFVGINALISIGKGSSADIHFLGLYLPFSAAGNYSFVELLIGHGYTSGGNLAKAIGVVNDANWLYTGAESGVGTIFFQTGIIGLIFVVSLYFRQLQKQSLPSKHLMTGYFILMFTQENMINMNYLFVLVFGVIVLNVYSNLLVRS